MTKDQMNWVRREYPKEVELLMSDMYEWPTSRLMGELIRWIPKSEFMKLVHQVEDNDE
jgi:hypothetical protein